MPKKLQSFVREEHSGPVEYKVGDSVLIKSEPPAKHPFIALIKEIHEPRVTEAGEQAQDMVVNWYYRPNEVHGGRKFFHGTQEVFESDHCDTCDVSSIISHCEVLSLDDYLECEYVNDHTFFTRYFYSASKREFKPDRVMVYCKCELPYNPDLPMVMCERCEEWFHLACVGLGGEGRGGRTPSPPRHYVCEQCQEPQAQHPSKRPAVEGRLTSGRQL